MHLPANQLKAATCLMLSTHAVQQTHPISITSLGQSSVCMEKQDQIHILVQRNACIIILIMHSFKFYKHYTCAVSPNWSTYLLKYDDGFFPLLLFSIYNTIING